MRYFAVFLAFLASCAAAQDSSTSYWLLLGDDGHTWCGYANAEAFQTAAADALPTESARVTFSGDRLTEITYQIAPESGDWMVIDKYVPGDTGLTLMRANLLVQENRKIVQEASISNGSSSPLRTIENTTLDGTVAGSNPVDYPEVPIRKDLSQFTFLEAVRTMRSQSLLSLCKEF